MAPLWYLPCKHKIRGLVVVEVVVVVVAGWLPLPGLDGDLAADIDVVVLAAAVLEAREGVVTRGKL